MSRPSKKLLEFEDLRGIAAFVVLIYHLRMLFPADPDSLLAAAFASWPVSLAVPIRAFLASLYDGDFAVWVFWVMSAFVLSIRTFTAYRKDAGAAPQDYLAEAALRRYPRLMIPAAASVVLAYTIHACGLMYNHQLAKFYGPPIEGGLLDSYYGFEPSAGVAAFSALWESFFRSI